MSECFFKHLHIWTFVFAMPTEQFCIMLREWWTKFLKVDQLFIWFICNQFWAKISTFVLELWIQNILIFGQACICFEHLNKWPFDPLDRFIFVLNIWTNEHLTTWYVLQCLADSNGEKAFPGDLLGVKDDGTAQSVPLALRWWSSKWYNLHLPA